MYLGGVGAQAGLSGESLATDCAVEGTVLGAFHLSVVVPQMLL